MTWKFGKPNVFYDNPLTTSFVDFNYIIQYQHFNGFWKSSLVIINANKNMVRALVLTLTVQMILTMILAQIFLLKLSVYFWYMWAELPFLGSSSNKFYLPISRLWTSKKKQYLYDFLQENCSELEDGYKCL